MKRREFAGVCAAGVAGMAVPADGQHSLVIDAHAHAGNMIGMGIREASFEEFLAAADEAGIHKMCVSSITALEFDAESGNRAVYELTKRYPDRILGVREHFRMLISASGAWICWNAP